MFKRKYKIHLFQIYSDSHVTCYIDLRNRAGIVCRNFHCEKIELLEAHLYNALDKLKSYGRDVVKAVLDDAIQKFGLDRAESDRRNKLPFTLRTK